MGNNINVGSASKFYESNNDNSKPIKDKSSLEKKVDSLAKQNISLSRQSSNEELAFEAHPILPEKSDHEMESKISDEFSHTYPNSLVVEEKPLEESDFEIRATSNDMEEMIIESPDEEIISDKFDSITENHDVEKRVISDDLEERITDYGISEESVPSDIEDEIIEMNLPSTGHSEKIEKEIPTINNIAQKKLEELQDSKDAHYISLKERKQESTIGVMKRVFVVPAESQYFISHGKVVGSGGYSDVLELIDKSGSFNTVYLKPKLPESREELGNIVLMYTNNPDIKNISNLCHYKEVIWKIQPEGSDKATYVKGLILPRMDETWQKRMENASPDEKLKYLTTLANTLSQLHAIQLYHLDLKPDNIMFLNGEPMIIDFGMMANLDKKDNPDRKEITEPRGTLEGYIPPDMFMSQKMHVSKMQPETSTFPTASKWEKQDVYSFGIIAYKTLVGESVPWVKSASSIQNFAKINHYTKHFRDSTQEYHTEVEQKLESLGSIGKTINQSLDPNPAKRPTMAEFNKVLAESRK